MTNFAVTFRGVRGSYPSAKQNFLKFGGNTSCVEVYCGKQLIVLDAGLGIVDIESPKTNQTTIILSHIHQDHIQGLQFYKPLLNPASKINLFGMKLENEDLKDTLSTILFDKVFPLSLNEIKSDFNINNFSENEIITITQDGKVQVFDKKTSNIKLNENIIKISSYKTTHPKDGCLCIKLEYNNKALVYATDKELLEDLEDEFIEFAKNCNCLIHDAQYTKEDYSNETKPKKGFGHSTFEMAINTMNKINAKKLFFFHYNPEYNDIKLQQLEKFYKKDNILFAKENYKFEL